MKYESTTSTSILLLLETAQSQNKMSKIMEWRMTTQNDAEFSKIICYKHMKRMTKSCTTVVHQLLKINYYLIQDFTLVVFQIFNFSTVTFFPKLHYFNLLAFQCIFYIFNLLFPHLFSPGNFLIIKSFSPQYR